EAPFAAAQFDRSDRPHGVAIPVVHRGVEEVPLAGGKVRQLRPERSFGIGAAAEAEVEPVPLGLALGDKFGAVWPVDVRLGEVAELWLSVLQDDVSVAHFANGDTGAMNPIEQVGQLLDGSAV